MWKCEPNQPVPPQVALVMEFDHSNSNTNWTGFCLEACKHLSEDFLLMAHRSCACPLGASGAAHCLWDLMSGWLLPERWWLLQQ